MEPLYGENEQINSVVEAFFAMAREIGVSEVFFMVGKADHGHHQIIADRNILLHLRRDPLHAIHPVQTTVGTIRLRLLTSQLQAREEARMGRRRETFLPCGQVLKGCSGKGY